MLRFALLPLLLTGCTTAVAQKSPNEGPAPLGQTVMVGSLSVRPDKVVEDSRCRPGVQCVWAGRLILRATVSGGAWSKQTDLTLGQPAQVADGALTLTTAFAPDAHNSYRFVFDFQGGL